MQIALSDFSEAGSAVGWPAHTLELARHHLLDNVCVCVCVCVYSGGISMCVCVCVCVRASFDLLCRRLLTARAGRRGDHVSRCGGGAADCGAWL
jgi:hypothetical protein